MSRTAILTITVAILALTAGCSSLGNSTAEDAENINSEPAQAQPAAELEAELSASDGASRETTKRPEDAVIRTAEVAIEVDNYQTTRANLNAEADAAGGFLASSDRQTITRGEQTQTSGTLVYRVPSEEFDSFYAAVEAEGNVTKASTDTEDVTDQLVDLEARITTLEEQRDRLRGFYDEANTTDELLAIEAQLSDVQSEIERLEAERQSLRKQVAYSTVTVDVTEPMPEREPASTADESWADRSIIATFLASVDGVQTAIRGTAVLVAYVTPYLLVFGGPLVVGFVGLRRWWQ